SPPPRPSRCKWPRPSPPKPATSRKPRPRFWPPPRRPRPPTASRWSRLLARPGTRFPACASAPTLTEPVFHQSKKARALPAPFSFATEQTMPTFDLVLLAVDLGLALYLLAKLYPVLKTGVIEKHARFPGCTRAGDPWTYWGVTISVLVGV